MWVDQSFNLCDACIGLRPLAENEQFSALPIREIFPGSICCKLGKSDLSIDHFDVMQGTLGDCWLLSAFSAIAYSTKLIQNVIVFNDDLYGVTIFKIMGRYVCVDHFIPVVFSDGRVSEIISPNVSREGESWPILLEKAFVKIFADQTLCPVDIWNFNVQRRMHRGILSRGCSYTDIDGGFPRWAFRILLNARLDPINTANVDLKTLLACEGSEDLVACACTRTEKNDSHQDAGFVYSHAYSVLKFDETRNLVRVRNPWGTLESTKFDDGFDDGEFWVDLEEFRTRFPILCVSKIKHTAKIILR